MKEQDMVILGEKEIHKLKNLSVAYNQDTFLLMINTKNAEDDNGYLLAIPADVMAEIVNGLYSSGVEYQRNFQKDVGFVREEV